MSKMRKLGRENFKWIGYGIAVIGLLMMGYGICRGEAEIVLTKAVRICLECIGIG